MKYNTLFALALCAATVGTNSNPLPASDLPPNNLRVSEVPQFVSIGFDDNAYSGLPSSGGDGGMTWLTDYFRHLNNPAGLGNQATFDGMPARVTFFYTTYYVSQHVSESAKYVRDSWRTAYDDGHEAANHTHNHKDALALNFGEAEWREEIEINESWMTKPYRAGSDASTHGLGLQVDDIIGLRSPFLNYNNALFTELRSHNYQYDASIEDGWQPEDDGTNYTWPYLLDNGSPGHDYLVGANIKNFSIEPQPGLMEMPLHPMIVPPDNKMADYGIDYSIRDRIEALNIAAYNPSNGKITGLDYTLWLQAKMNKAEFLATLKYTLDLRLAGNRAPFLFGAHSGEYSPKWTGDTVASTRERQEAIEEFIQYALSKPEVRIRPYRDVLAWMKKPVALDINTLPSYPLSTTIAGEQITTRDCDQPAWDSSQIYPGGDTISYNGRQYNAKWWTQNDLPTAGDPWLDQGGCGSTTTIYHGSVTPSTQNVSQGQQATFTITADKGYLLDDVIVNGASQGPVNPLILNDVNESKEIKISFIIDSQAVDLVEMNASAATGGSISPEGRFNVAIGSRQDFTIRPASGHQIESVLVNGIDQGPVSNVIIDPVNAATTVSARFKVTSNSGCTAPAWSADTIYLLDDKVSHLGHSWSAKWWTRGNEPAFSGYVEWQGLGPC